MIVSNKIILIILLLVPMISGSHASPLDSITGTYSTLRYHSEAGDLLGIEVRIIYTRKGLKVVVQVAEGGAGDIFIANVLQKKNNISFDVPYTKDIRGTFSGKLTNKGLEGTLLLPNGETEELFLPRTQSYWDKTR